MGKKPAPDLAQLNEFEVSMKFNLEQLPLWFHSLPTTVKNCALLDMMQGAMFGRRWKALCAEGMTKEVAKEQVCPDHGGNSYLSVYFRMADLPTQLSYGTASAPVPANILPFIQKKALVNALLGISSTNGGGPNLMAAWSMWPQLADRLVTEHGFRREFPLRVAQVLLYIKKEHPNGWGSEDHVVWPADSLMFRTNALLTLGRLLNICVFIGGFGTHEEIFRSAVDDQLLGHIETTVNYVVPITFLDFRRADGTSYWQHFRRHVEVLVEDGCIRAKDAQHFHYIDVEAPDSVDELTRIQDRVGQQLFGYSLVDRFMLANGISVYDAAEELLPELLKVTPLAKAANGD